VRREGGLAPDDFRHELVVALRERECLVVLTGCSHHGLVNMVETVAAEFPGTAIKAVVGGFHLAALPPFRGMSESATTVGGDPCAGVERHSISRDFALDFIGFFGKLLYI